jgi:hypothetical protein
MVRSTGSQPRVVVKRRGSKWQVADAESLNDRDAARRDTEGALKMAGELGRVWGDDRSLDPGRDRQAPVLAQ